LSPAAVERLVTLAVDRWGVTPFEITLEANPSSHETPDWAGLRAAGVNRISLGVQSLHDSELWTLARGQTAAEGLAAFAAARAARFDNLSIDLIYGIPGQSLSDWTDGLALALALQPDHLSLYALSLALAPDEWAAPPRPGALRWRHRQVVRQDDDLAADQYTAAEETLGAAGYRHYELSSWALAGRESVHNGAYWARRAYTGVGAGAHSYDGHDRRWWNERDLDAYLDAIEADRSPVAGTEELDEPTRAFEAVALGLRRVDGLERLAFAAEFGEDPVARFAAASASGAEAGLLEITPDTLRLTARGRLLANDALAPFAP
jgi:oxygen-independent coproporphyrinogen-3 oxidase